MKLLFKAALQNRSHLLLLIGTFIAMLLLTLATQLELFSLGIIVKSGTDLFALFDPQGRGSLSLQDIAHQWNTIAPEGTLTPRGASNYLELHGKRNLVQQISLFLHHSLGISTSHLPRLALLLVVVALWRATMLFVHRYLTQLVSIRVSRDLRQRFFEHMQLLPLSFYAQHNAGSLSSRVIADASTIATALNAWLLTYLHTPLVALTTLGGCFLISWKLSLIVFVGFPLVIFPMLYLARRIKRVAKQIQKNQEGFATVLIDFLSGIQTVKIFAMEDFSLKKYREQNETMAQLEERSARYGLAPRPIMHTISSLFFAMVIFAGLYFFRLGVAEILVFCGMLYVFYEPIKKFAEEHNQILRGVAAAERMYEVLELKPAIQDHPGAIELTSFDEEIVFDNVSFRYEGEWVLKNLSFRVKKGETVAIVGPTGSGKSTIVQLLPRLYEVEEGEIRIDGKPLAAYTQRSLRECIAFVPQKPFLFLDTVRENIAFGKPFSQEEIVDAAQRAQAEEFILRLPGQYDAFLSEGGKNLSGGQQQRLAIARALVKRAPILVLDEATSSLDVLSEQLIKEATASLHGEVTQIVIAHRLTTIEHADRILYVDGGRKIAEGTRLELLESCADFRRMWESIHASEDRLQQDLR